MKIKQYRALIINLKEIDIYLVLDACMLLGKNVYNAVLFLLHNLISSYVYDKTSKSYTIKTKLHTHQIETLDLFNQAIHKLNEDRELKYQTKLAEYNKQLVLNVKLDIIDIELKEPKPSKVLSTLTNNISIKEFHHIVLDKTLIEQTLKLKESINNNYIDYSKIPSIISQYALQKAVNNISIYYKSLNEYFKSFKAGQLANVPQLPKYLAKNERLTLELHHSYFTKIGTLFKINPNKHTLFTNFFKQQETLINTQTIDLFNNFNLKEILLNAINKRLYKNNSKHKGQIEHTEYNLQTVRFVPQRISNKGKNKYPLKIEVIIEVQSEINNSSPLALLIHYYEENKLQYNKTKLTYHELKDSIKHQIIMNFIKDNPHQLTYLAGGDLGQNNLFSLALTKGTNQLYSGKKINSYLTKLNSKLDKLKTSIFESTLSKDLYEKVKYNQQISLQNHDIVKYNSLYKLSIEDKLEKLDKISLTKDELISLKEANHKVYENIIYNKTLVEMENYKNNILHKLSENIISHCIKNQIQCLVVGHNEHWKQEVNLSKKTNRLFMSIPHGQLIEVLEYKCLSIGILFITTEESYTSKSSFLHSDILPIYHKTKSSKTKTKSKTKKENLTNQNEELSKSINPVEAENNHSHIINEVEIIESNKPYVFSGTRNKHEYKLKIYIKRHHKIHADMNGAFNMLRKIFSEFKYDDKISIDYKLNNIIHQNYHKIGNKKNFKRTLASPSSTESSS